MQYVVVDLLYSTAPRSIITFGGDLRLESRSYPSQSSVGCLRLILDRLCEHRSTREKPAPGPHSPEVPEMPQ